MIEIVVSALMLWGAWFTVPEIRTQYHQPTQDIDAQGMAWASPAVVGQPYCLISVHPTDFPALTAFNQMAVMLHEVGHCLGLGHYGDCWDDATIMASCALAEPTMGDRIELIRLRGYRTVAPMVGH